VGSGDSVRQYLTQRGKGSSLDVVERPAGNSENTCRFILRMGSRADAETEPEGRGLTRRQCTQTPTDLKRPAESLKRLILLNEDDQRVGPDQLALGVNRSDALISEVLL
jgi:hypothetical protein